MLRRYLPCHLTAYIDADVAFFLAANSFHAEQAIAYGTLRLTP